MAYVTKYSWSGTINLLICFYLFIIIIYLYLFKLITFFFRAEDNIGSCARNLISSIFYFYSFLSLYFYFYLSQVKYGGGIILLMYTFYVRCIRDDFYYG